ncbi:hypothetical protein K8O68_14200 [Salipaludibacillus sp. CUR1]|uniref:hypothetical protein n=1 Tax=Salipaludibacillus sp. CUR1 TaxID=2820003 RepID=UPI001E32AF5D|nr:hypothetical protein [Salipaludibacillus sp. CUR1]MCE7793573.1 hypothetical protein [Salipaludibacillus sp. CUR1]
MESRENENKKMTPQQGIERMKEKGLVIKKTGGPGGEYGGFLKSTIKKKESKKKPRWLSWLCK